MNLRDWLKENGKKQSDLVADCGYTKAKASRLCRGIPSKREDYLKIYDYTGGEVTPNHILEIGE